jgi:2-polyprenyl-3-methyl-5-hydroxy-6-metoxy-1,4-benzoquinol methylase
VLHEGLRDRFAPGPEEWAFRRCGDPECGLLWLDPVPLEADIARAYHEDYYTHRDVVPSLTWYRRGYRWLKQGYLARRFGYRLEATPPWQRILGLSIWLDPRRRADVDVSVVHLPFRPGGRLLEVGCGDGAVLKTLCDLGWVTEGVELDPDAVANARKKGLKVHPGRLESLHLDGGRFDAVVLRHVVEHVHDPRRLLGECRRVLHPQGTLVVLTPNARSLGHRVFKGSWFSVESSGLVTSRLETRRREGWLIWRCSRQIRASGRATPFAPRTLAERAGGLLFEAAEAALLVVSPSMGEEILLVAGHPRGRS